MKSDLQARMKVREKLGVVDVNSLRGVRALGGNIRKAGNFTSKKGNNL